MILNLKMKSLHFSWIMKHYDFFIYLITLELYIEEKRHNPDTILDFLIGGDHKMIVHPDQVVH